MVAEEETIQKQTKQLKRISYWAKKVQDKFNEEERELDRLEHRYCRYNNIEEDTFFFEDRWDDDYYLSWKEYEHLTEELDVAGMTCSELAACLPFFGLYPYYSCWWNPSDTRYRRNKNRYQFWSIPNLSNKDYKFLIQLYNKAVEEGYLPKSSSWCKSRTNRLAEAFYDLIQEIEERINYLEDMKERLSSDGDEVLVDTEYDQINGKMEEEIKIQELPNVSGSSWEIRDS